MKQTGKSRGHMHPRKQSLRLPSSLIKQRLLGRDGDIKNTKNR
jgi:hypothetical protein